MSASERARQALERNRRLLETRGPAGTPSERTLREYNEAAPEVSRYRFIRESAGNTGTKFPFGATINGRPVLVWPDRTENLPDRQGTRR